jgi:hypothetical protein
MWGKPIVMSPSYAEYVNGGDSIGASQCSGPHLNGIVEVREEYQGTEHILRQNRLKIGRKGFLQYFPIVACSSLVNCLNMGIALR